MKNFLVPVVLWITLSWAVADDPFCLRDSMSITKRENPSLSSILDFELNLFRNLTLTNVEQNFIFSPYSIWNALVMAYLGASGRTENQLKFALSLTDKESTRNWLRMLLAIYKRRNSDNKGANTLNLVNKIYFDDQVLIKGCLQGALHNEIENIDFDQPGKAAKSINDLVSNVTNGKIQNLVAPDALTGTLMAIINAAYFKGTWQHPFKEEKTNVHAFEALDGSLIDVDTMEQYGQFKTVKDETLQAEIMEFPYIGEKIAMYLFLPMNKGKLNLLNMIKNFGKDSLLRVMDKFNKGRPRFSRLRLPKFKIETQIDEALIQVLREMGISDAFSRTNADFSDFSDDQYLYLSKSTHKAYINVDEKGTEAAAVTLFISNKFGGINMFDCQRPFVYAIVDTELKHTIFVGSLVKPEASTKPGPPKQDQARNERSRDSQRRRKTFDRLSKGWLSK